MHDEISKTAPLQILFKSEIGYFSKSAPPGKKCARNYSGAGREQKPAAGARRGLGVGERGRETTRPSPAGQC